MGNLRRRLLRLARAKWLTSQREPYRFEPSTQGTPDLDAGSTPRAAPGLDPEIARCLEVLELPPGASPDEVRSAYRRLCQRYHPDRFAADPERARLANELLAEINRAYGVLRAQVTSRPASP